MDSSYPVDSRGYGDDRAIAAYMGVSPGRLRKLRHEGRAPRAVRIGRSVRTSFAAADAYMAERAERV